MKIAFLSAECAPFIKAGGLGDVVGSLPRALLSLGVKPIVILANNQELKLKKYRAKKQASFKVVYNKKAEQVILYKIPRPKDAPVYVIANKKYLDNTNVYDSLKKFLFYSLASLEAMKHIRFQPDIIHCHDHQAGMVSNILKTSYKNDKFFAGSKTVFTIHNLNYQGEARPTILKSVDNGIEDLQTVLDDKKDGDINFMVQGILSGDAITTVSPRYAREILTKKFGAGLDNILRKRKKDLYGILNGIDTDLFNPATDKNLKYNYDVNSLETKKKNKLVLQKKLGLPRDTGIPLVGFVSRLVYQKGVDLITDALVKNTECQFVILGTGQDKYHKHLKALQKKYPDKFSARIEFSVEIAQRIYAASDMFLIPSRYEPCGLTQMIAMRYGTVPVARKTGGLADTVYELRIKSLELRNKANGFVFQEFSPKAMEKALNRALNLYYEKPKKWLTLQKNGMKTDFSWKKSAKEYVKLYRKLAKS